MMLLTRIRNQRRKIDQSLRTVQERRDLTPILYAHDRIVLPILRQYASGRTIDLGCGFMPFRSALLEHVDRYHSMDIIVQHPEITFVGDLQNLDMLIDDCYDTAICIEVLEHLPEPGLALDAIWRILRPGGILVLTVPHLSRLHDIPHDYFRFTEYGLRHLLEKSGFVIVNLQVKGGLFTFLGHQISTLLLTLCWSLPVLNRLVWQVNKWLLVRSSYYLDRWFDRSHIFAQGYVVVAKKLSHQMAKAARSDNVWARQPK